MAKRKQPKKAKKHAPSEAELQNDPSLKYFAYHQWESLWSDTHSDYKRFVAYTESGKIKLAEMNSIAAIDGEFDPLTLRRASAHYTQEDFAKIRNTSEGRFRPLFRGLKR